MNTLRLIMAGSQIAIKENLRCDDPLNKRGFSYRGNIRKGERIKVLAIEEFGGVTCAVVKVHHCMGVSYYGAAKIVPMSEFNDEANWRPLN